MPFGTRLRHASGMTTYHHAVVWIDHKLAKLVQFNAESSELVIVNSTHPHQHLHHKANADDSGHAPVDKKYLEHVAAALAKSGTILVVGPASAKAELVTFLKTAHPAIHARISAVEAMDHPTDGQLLAHARRFFDADDRMRPPLRA
jgi:hypothetical protein